MFGHTKVRGYHPLVAAVSGTGDVVHSRQRGGNAHSSRGAASFLTETFGRVRAAGATGRIVLRADSGFYSRAVVDACRRADVRFSITAKLHKGGVKTASAASDESCCRPVTDSIADPDPEPQSGDGRPGRVDLSHGHRPAGTSERRRDHQRALLLVWHLVLRRRRQRQHLALPYLK